MLTSGCYGDGGYIVYMTNWGLMELWRWRDMLHNFMLLLISTRPHTSKCCWYSTLALTWDEVSRPITPRNQ
nr:hypothetical protein [Tanacetum cinerariifolium]